MSAEAGQDGFKYPARKVERMGSSDISGFYKLPPKQRLALVKKFAGLTDEECEAIAKTGALAMDAADRMIENVVGTHELPFGIATNFMINGKDYLIPMVLEEPSVVAAASNAAKLARPSGGFKTASDEPVMIGQIQVVGTKDAAAAAKAIANGKKQIIELANQQDPTLVKFGGGARGLEARVIDTQKGKMVIVHLLVDVRDAMGANAVNTMAEAVSPLLEELSGGRVRLRIISNFAVKRLARAKAVWKKQDIGEDAVNGVVEAYAFADADLYRCATHNKGIMNGIDAVVIATGNDFRAVEAGAHAYAARDGRYQSLTKYHEDQDGNLVGEIELPVAVGLVGGATRTHPTAKAAVRILGVKTAKELSEIIAAVGLAQNFAALRALSTVGIQEGHMKLHAKNIAIMGGATADIVDQVAAQLVKEKKIRVERAKEIVDALRKNK
ncbi:MAG: hydroxymethylglutaryl-CoA reductase, degradative [Candidatus Aenigmarchaeota archaeon]|nr:hydroxymethylglutaryl-CoA reductase, degradative [Candidatus Aenigmarchaeota archaeon]